MSTINYKDIKENISDFLEKLKQQLSQFTDNNSLIVSILIDLIENETITDIYEKIPDDIEKVLTAGDFFESEKIVKNILITYGIDKEVVDQLSIDDLQKILKLLPLFIKSPSTPVLYKSILDIFHSDIYAAELLLVYDKTGNNVYLVPDWINEPPDSIKEKYKTIDYNIAYNKIPELLISRETWIEQFQNNKAISPIRTNIIFFTAENSNKINIINEIIAQIVYNYLKNSTFTFILNDKKYVINFEDSIKLYYYIVALFFNLEYLTINQPASITLTYSSENTAFTYNDIETLINYQKNVKDKKSFTEYYNYIKQHYHTITKSQPTQYTFDELQSDLYSKYSDLIQQLNSIYNSSSNKKTDLIRILTQYKHQLAYNYRNIEYFSIFLDTYIYTYISQISDAPEFTLLYYYKPYHVLIFDLLSDYLSIVINDKLDALFIDDSKFNFLFQFLYVDFFYFRDIVTVVSQIYQSERYNINDVSQYSLDIIIKEYINIIDKLFMTFYQQHIDFQYFRDLLSNIINIPKSDRITINDILAAIYVYLKNIDNLKIDSKYILTIFNQQVDYQYFRDFIGKIYLNISKFDRNTINDILSKITLLSTYKESIQPADKYTNYIYTQNVDNQIITRYYANTNNRSKYSSRLPFYDIVFVDVISE